MRRRWEAGPPAVDAPLFRRAALDGCELSSSRDRPSVLVEPQRLEIPPVRLQRVAVLLVSGGVLGAGEQEQLAITVRVAPIVLQQAKGDLLVVGIVAVLEGIERQ